MASMDGKKAREEGGKSELPYVCTLLCSWYVLAVSRKGKERTTHGEIDKEHLILWDRRDLNRCTDKGAFAWITGSTSLKSSPFLSTDFEDTYVLSALYIVYVVQAGVNTRLLAASRHSNLLNELKNRILLFNTSIFGLGPRNPY